MWEPEDTYDYRSSEFDRDCGNKIYDTVHMQRREEFRGLGWGNGAVEAPVVIQLSRQKKNVKGYLVMF